MNTDRITETQELAVSVSRLSKRYRIGMKEMLHETFAGSVAAWLRSPLAAYRRLRKLSVFNEAEGEDDIIWALREVSLEVRRGEIVGIIGPNGAGKTTLLKILSRITEPTRGEARTWGRVASLLEVGTGFHPDLTGRENIYLNGTILGMTRREVDVRFDAIVEFAGVSRFIDTPVKRYSSGMAVRLAFAVGAHLEPETLLVDEVLAVGDAAFQRKCMGKMDEVSRGGRTVLFVSHNMTAIAGLCSRAIWLDGGTVRADGPARDVVADYLGHVRGVAESTSVADRSDRTGTGYIRVTSLAASNDAQSGKGAWICGREAVLDVGYICRADHPLDGVHVAVGVRSQADAPLLYFSTRLTGDLTQGLTGHGTFRCHIPRLPLEPGSYLLNVEVLQGDVKADHVRSAARVDVQEGPFYPAGVMSTYGGVGCDHSWECLPEGEGA